MCFKVYGFKIFKTITNTMFSDDAGSLISCVFNVCSTHLHKRCVLQWFCYWTARGCSNHYKCNGFTLACCSIHNLTSNSQNHCKTHGFSSWTARIWLMVSGSPAVVKHSRLLRTINKCIGFGIDRISKSYCIC